MYNTCRKNNYGLDILDHFYIQLIMNSGDFLTRHKMYYPLFNEIYNKKQNIISRFLRLS